MEAEGPLHHCLGCEAGARMLWTISQLAHGSDQEFCDLQAATSYILVLHQRQEGQVRVTRFPGNSPSPLSDCRSTEYILVIKFSALLYWPKHVLYYSSFRRGYIYIQTRKLCRMLWINGYMGSSAQ